MGSPEAEFAAFKKWQAEKAAAETVPDEEPAVTLAEVLHALVNSAQFPAEATARTYHDAINAHFAPNVESVEATDGV